MWKAPIRRGLRMACGRRFRYPVEAMIVRTSRRAFFASAGTALAAAASAQQSDWSGIIPVRFPDPDIVSLDERLD